MKTFEDVLTKIKDERQREVMTEVLSWVRETYQQLVPAVKWSEPMFTNNGTFIIGFNAAKKYFAVAPEPATIKHFMDEILATGYSLYRKFSTFHLGSAC